MAVLILSSASDPHATSVAEHLDKVGVPHKIWSFSEFLHSSSVSFLPGASAPSNHMKFLDDSEIVLSDLQAIWCRRPGSFKAPPMPEPWVEAMIELECKNALGGLIRSAECLLVNHPGRDAESLYKLSQLAVARRVGLHVPETLVTNEPDQAREFYDRFSGRVIYKLIGENTNFCFPRFEFPSGIPTLPCHQSDLAYFDQVKLAPHLFQQRVEKTFEIRATIVGEEIFAAKIDSQKGDSKLDWRMDYNVPMSSIDLPDKVAEACLAMMRGFALNYAAFDFCVDAENRYFFLELNCAGQYLWLENRVGLPISRQLARLLSGQAKPIVEAVRPSETKNAHDGFS